MKKYCECYQSGAFCSAICKCEQCLNIKAESNEQTPEQFPKYEKEAEEQPYTPFNIMKKKLDKSSQKSTSQKSTQSRRKRPGEHSSSRRHLKEMLKIAQGKEKREKQVLLS